MTNICQAIEEEIKRMEFAAEQAYRNELGYKFRPDMSCERWHEILISPTTLRVEASVDFAEQCRELLLEQEESDTFFNKPLEPSIVYIPDIKDQLTLIAEGDTNRHNEELYDGYFCILEHDSYYNITSRVTSVDDLKYWVLPRDKSTYNEKTKSFDVCAPVSTDDIERVTSWTDPNSPKYILQNYRYVFGLTMAVLTMMNQPNFVTQTTVGSSGVRKKLEKKKGIPRERWSRIQWNVGQQVQRHVRETMGEEHCTALHRVRGFYRKAKSHYNNVTKIDGKWFQWIEPFWRGHPAFGIIKSSYAPKIEQRITKR